MKVGGYSWIQSPVIVLETRVTKLWVNEVQHGRKWFFLLHLDDKETVSGTERIDDLQD